MTERPILFNTGMVRAILSGKKTQTRRIIKYIPALGEPSNWCPRCDALSKYVGDFMSYCPFGKIGDHLWLRETHLLSTRNRWPDLPHKASIPGGPGELPEFVSYYKASFDRSTADILWRPSIHMPKWASRVSLEIVSVRAERLQDITVEDALKEGIDHHPMNCPRMEFAQLWNSINKKPGLCWEDNPYIWAIDFKPES